MDVKNRLNEALDIRNMKQIELSEKTGLSKAQINSWKNNKWQPKQSALHKMAKALDVSEMWLAGYDVPMERPEDQKRAEEVAALINVIKDDPQLKSLLTYIIKLTPEQINTIEPLLKQLVEKDK